VSLEPSDGITNGEKRIAEFAALRKLLIGPEQNRLDELSEEIESQEVTAEEIADRLPEAIALSGSRDDQLGRALSPTIETALKESIRRDPQEIATAIFPVLGPAIRKAIAETMAGLVRSINNAVEQSLSVNGMKWRVEAWRTGIPYAEIVIKHALVYRVEQAYLIHAESGLLLEHVSAPDLDAPDADLISSMLSAIQDFVRDSFHPEEGAMLRTFSVGAHTVQVEAGPRALLALVIRGEAPGEVLRKEQDALETIHLELASQLAEFAGDTAPFAPARPLLEGCLETVLTTTQARKRGGLVWLRWALPLLLIVAALGFLWVRSTIRWRRGLTALRAEPGYVVVDASRGWNKWNISGLKDPAARAPGAVLSGVGAVPKNLSGRWEGYLSLDPVMVAARAKQSLDSLKRTVEGERVLFDAGSADISEAAANRIRRVALVVEQLDRAARALGGSIRVQLTGRTDPTGRDETNQTLARRRVQNVSELLSASGVDPSNLKPDPVATAKPLLPADPQERPRINRSVSFTVDVLAALLPPGGQR
jgi:outer membrane protein OmpA-like peptidoglycan-associated protein/DNA-binding transcriptional ArsR family regulator